MKIEKLDRRRPPLIVIFGFDGVNALDLTGPLETFTVANREEGVNSSTIPYEIKLIGVTGRSFVSESGAVFESKYTLRSAFIPDTVIFPGGEGIQKGETNRRIAEWLTHRAVGIRRIVSICGGVYAVARTGMLDARKVTTHWRLVQDLRQRFPKVEVDPAASFVKDGRFYSCGGGTAAIELSLALIQEDYGPRRALSVARELVMRLRPPGERDGLLDRLQFECGPMDRFADLPGWIALHLNINLSVEVLANRVCLCPRHFSRLFKRVFHISPASFVEQLRLDEARRRLCNGDNSVENVGLSVGFRSADAFRRAFERRLGVSPSEYRRRFSSFAKAPVARDRRREPRRMSVAA